MVQDPFRGFQPWMIERLKGESAGGPVGNSSRQVQPNSEYQYHNEIQEFAHAGFQVAGFLAELASAIMTGLSAGRR